MTACDVIVIGGGHNGLVTAALLAGRGRKVTVLERHAVVGGLAIGDEFHPGFTAAGLLHDTGGSSHDETIALDDAAVLVEVTVTDGDGDTATDDAAVGEQIKFGDDGPAVTVDDNSNMVTHD